MKENIMDSANDVISKYRSYFETEEIYIKYNEEIKTINDKKKIEKSLNYVSDELESLNINLSKINANDEDMDNYRKRLLEIEVSVRAIRDQLI